MKAADYVKRMQVAEPMVGFSGAVHQVACGLLSEVNALRSQRSSRSLDAQSAILHEQDQKWAAICRLDKRLDPDGFRRLLKREFPEVWDLWRNSRRPPKQPAAREEGYGIWRSKT